MPHEQREAEGFAMDDITLDDVIEVLEDVKEDVDYENEDALVDGHVWDSFDILAVISALNDEFDISIPATEIVPTNFNSIAAMEAMVKRLADE